MAMELKVKDKVHKVKFGYNSFCDTDLMDRTQSLIKIFQNNEAEDDKDVAALGKIKELFVCVRDLLFVGFEKFNPAGSKQEVGNILDDWREEAKEGEKRGLLDLFARLSDELMNEGFFGDMMKQLTESADDLEKELKKQQNTKK